EPIDGQDNTWRLKPGVKEALGPVGYKTGGHPHIFPNTWITGSKISLRIPKGPAKTEIWWFVWIDEELDQDKWLAQLHAANHVFGPAGMLEQDDGENWDQSTRGTMG